MIFAASQALCFGSKDFVADAFDNLQLYAMTGQDCGNREAQRALVSEALDYFDIDLLLRHMKTFLRTNPSPEKGTTL